MFALSGGLLVGCGRSGLDGLEQLVEQGADGNGGSGAAVGGSGQGGSKGGATTGGSSVGAAAGSAAAGAPATGGSPMGGAPGRGGEPGDGGAAEGGSAGEVGCEGDACDGCATGTYSTSGSGACVPWSSCKRGQYVLQQPGASRDRLCAPCPAGSTTKADNEAQCAPIAVTQVASSYYHSCARFDDGSARCWGLWGALGNGEIVNDVGDDELPSAVGAVTVSTDPDVTVVQVATGVWSSCALLSNQDVKCWGANNAGQLGQGTASELHDPAEIASIAVGNDADDAIEQLVSGQNHVCVRLASGRVRCWGLNHRGQLGQGRVDNIGDDELPSSLPAISGSSEPGVTVTQLSAGAFYTCAILSNATIKCWGDNDSQQLGYGNTTVVGDDELPSTLPDVRVSNDSTVVPVQIVTGYAHTCVLLSDASVKCWGRASEDYPSPPSVQTPADLPPQLIAPSGTHVVSLAAGYFHTCALLSDRSVKCWGNGGYGQLGYGEPKHLNLAEAGLVSVLDSDEAWVTELSAGAFHTCARLSDGHAKCWGWNVHGILGQGSIVNVGDNELPSSIGPISFF